MKLTFLGANHEVTGSCNGFRGRIYATIPTVELCGIMLRDSAHIQEFEAEWKNRKGKRAGAEPVEPMYTIQDAEAACRLFRGVEYGKRIACWM